MKTRRFEKVFLTIMIGSISCAHADYAKGMTSFQLYGGGAFMSGTYDHPSNVDEDERDYADAGTLFGGQFFYFAKDSVAVGLNIAHARFGDHESVFVAPGRLTSSSAKSTAGEAVARLIYPKGAFRPYIQGGAGIHRTSLSLEGTPLAGSSWSDTSTMERRNLYDETHTGPLISAAVGIHIYFTPRFFIGAEYKQTALISRDFSPTSAGRLEGLRDTDGSVVQSAIGFLIGLGF